MQVYTSRIWNFSRESGLAARDGEVVLCEDETITDFRDAERPITITDGLQQGDIAVFLDIMLPNPETNELEAESHGYAVGDITAPRDGSGVIVHGTKVDGDPQSWATPTIVDAWSQLELDSPGACAEFGLSGLYTYIKNTTSASAA